MRGWIARSALVMAVAICATNARATAVQARGTSIPLYSLTALLSVAPDLPAISRRTLLAEAERIWQREGVRLQWPDAQVRDASAPLRVLVIARREVLTGKTGRWPVGELVPQTGRRALAIASIAGAERVLVEADHRTPLLDSPELADYRLGVVLGRAVAHEIGHYLLGTATHADQGLMRAAIDAREFADPDARTFALDATAGQWVRNQLLAARGDAALPSSGFTYGHAADPE